MERRCQQSSCITVYLSQVKALQQSAGAEDTAAVSGCTMVGKTRSAGSHLPRQLRECRSSTSQESEQNSFPESNPLVLSLAGLLGAPQL